MKFDVYRCENGTVVVTARNLHFSTALLECKLQTDKCKADSNGSIRANPNGHGWVVCTPSLWENKPNAVLFTIEESVS